MDSGYSTYPWYPSITPKDMPTMDEPMIMTGHFSDWRGMLEWSKLGSKRNSVRVEPAMGIVSSIWETPEVSLVEAVMVIVM